MRPDRFQAFTLDIVKNTPDARVQTLTEAGIDTYPYGLAIVTPAGEARWQIYGRLATSERHTDPDAPVTSTPVPAGAPPSPGDSPEGWLAAVLAQAQSPEIASIDRWSTRPGKNKAGITVAFHNGVRAFIRQI
ncbi:hypothetical protein ACFRCX_30590 [Streptomyces sp. NPDC056652]|uniref:hypothetical protein n=1 Tax=Streptomyces sp. NPDC056652 TaxID=3345893 RepID=UPI00369F9839